MLVKLLSHLLLNAFQNLNKHFSFKSLNFLIVLSFISSKPKSKNLLKWFLHLPIDRIIDVLSFFPHVLMKTHQKVNKLLAELPHYLLLCKVMQSFNEAFSVLCGLFVNELFKLKLELNEAPWGVHLDCVCIFRESIKSFSTDLLCEVVKWVINFIFFLEVCFHLFGECVRFFKKDSLTLLIKSHKKFLKDVRT